MKQIKRFVPAVLATALLFGCSNDKNEVVKEKETSPPKVEKQEEVVKEVIPTSPTTGLPMEKEPVRSFGVMVENSPSARPHTGIIDADVVYEIETEAQITRYFAIFHDKVPTQVGPVRSSRHYFIPLAEEWNSPYIHFGGSPQAYSYLETVDIPKVDGIKTERKYFKRDNSRKAPHNAYLQTNSLPEFKLNADKEHFKYNEKSPYESAVSATTIDIKYNSFTEVQYKYDSAKDVYLRFQEGQPHSDRETKAQISPKNVIIQYATQYRIENDASGRIEVELDKEGQAVILLKGKKVDGTWKKENGVTKFYDDKGNLVTLTPGQTWIQILSTSKTAVIQ